MRIKPNKTIVEGRVKQVRRAADGFGADVDFEVGKSEAAEGYSDFLGAAPGSTITLFAALPEEIEAGKDYRLTTSVSGGPGGERVVIEAVGAKD